MAAGCPAFTIWSNGPTGIRQVVQEILLLPRFCPVTTYRPLTAREPHEPAPLASELLKLRVLGFGGDEDGMSGVYLTGPK
jgi:hypothetical protein